MTKSSNDSRKIARTKSVLLSRASDLVGAGASRGRRVVARGGRVAGGGGGTTRGSSILRFRHSRGLVSALFLLEIHRIVRPDWEVSEVGSYLGLVSDEVDFGFAGLSWGGGGDVDFGLLFGFLDQNVDQGLLLVLGLGGDDGGGWGWWSWCLEKIVEVSQFYRGRTILVFEHL